jgi:transcriptional regulator with XRE-family HTH domain
MRELRTQKSWKQDDLASKLGTSGVIIGRYERGETTPSIRVAHKVAEIFGVTLDALIADRDLPEILEQSEMLERWRAIDDLKGEDRDRILFVVDSLIREAKTRKAFAHP